MDESSSSLPLWGRGSCVLLDFGSLLVVIITGWCYGLLISFIL